MKRILTLVTLVLVLFDRSASLGRCQDQASIFGNLVPSSSPSAEAHPLQDENGSILIGDARLGDNNLGWTANLETNVLAPHLRTRLSAPIPFPTGGVLAGPTLSLPAANLDWTSMPRLEVGYRFGQAMGEILLSYRDLITRGSETLPNADQAGNPGDLHTRLAIRVLDLDYAHHEATFSPLWDMKWRAGVRLTDYFFDTRSTTPLEQDRISDMFFGAGPHAALELRRQLGHGFSLYGKLDGSSPIGRVTQRYDRNQLGVDQQTRLVSPTPLVSMQIQAGLTWSINDRWGITTGYTFEQWWDLVTLYGTNRGIDTTLQGFFLRGEWKY